MSPESIFSDIQKHYYKRVCLTGGEPLLQNDLPKLLKLMQDYEVSIETNGSIDISDIKLIEKHHFVMDMKVPSSEVSEKMVFKNFSLLRHFDEIKFVIGSRSDYEWSREVIKCYYKKGIITFSPIFGSIEYREIVEWILEDKLNVRFQLQLHKIIWDPEKRGV